MPRGRVNSPVKQRWQWDRSANSPVTYKLDMSGDDAFVKAFNEMPIRIRKRVFDKVVNNTAKKTAVIMRQNYSKYARVRTGALEKSLLQNRRPRSYRKGAIKLSYVQARAESVGARKTRELAESLGRKVNPRFFTATKKIRDRASKLGLVMGEDVKPNKYSHLVEHGQYKVRKTRAFLFMEKTMQAHGARINANMAAQFAPAIAREYQTLLNKYNKKNKR